MFSAFDFHSGEYSGESTSANEHDVGELLHEEIGEGQMEPRISGGLRDSKDRAGQEDPSHHFQCQLEIRHDARLGGVDVSRLGTGHRNEGIEAVPTACFWRRHCGALAWSGLSGRIGLSLALDRPTCRQCFCLPKHRLHSRILQVRRIAVLPEDTLH
jgi:hypothetical protein